MIHSPVSAPHPLTSFCSVLHRCPSLRLRWASMRTTTACVSNHSLLRLGVPLNALHLFETCFSSVCLLLFCRRDRERHSGRPRRLQRLRANDLPSASLAPCFAIRSLPLFPHCSLFLSLRPIRWRSTISRCSWTRRRARSATPPGQLWCHSAVAAAHPCTRSEALCCVALVNASLCSTLVVSETWKADLTTGNVQLGSLTVVDKDITVFT